MGPLFMDGHIDFTEFELGNLAQCLIEREPSETERGTCDVHGGLRVLKESTCHAFVHESMPWSTKARHPAQDGHLCQGGGL